MGIITDPRQTATYPTPEQIAEVVYEAATDGRVQLRYVARSRKGNLRHVFADGRRGFSQSDDSAVLRTAVGRHCLELASRSKSLG